MLITRKRIRLPNYDYSQQNCYYLTICTENRQEIFGVIEDNQMILNNIGKVVSVWWGKTFEKYNNIAIDEYIIMPNHIHGIINVVGAGSPRPDKISLNVNNQNDDSNGHGNRAPTIGNIIAYFKYQTTKQINQLENKSGRKIWQRNYYDQVIRNEKSLGQIRKYIINNPTNWSDDAENACNNK